MKISYTLHTLKETDTNLEIGSIEKEKEKTKTS